MFAKYVCVTGYMEEHTEHKMHVHTSLEEAKETQKNSSSWQIIIDEEKCQFPDELLMDRTPIG